MHLRPLESDKPVIVYIDFKSPYAYLAVEPTRRLENELGIEFDWRPFVLDIPSYLGSAELDSAGNVAEQNRTATQWEAVKYAYYDCRRYASISGLTIRGTTKIWNTILAASAMLWLRKEAPHTIPKFVDSVYVPFWKRELDIEDAGAITKLLNSCGVAGTQFNDWYKTTGAAFNNQFQSEAFAAGIYGVASYVVNGEIFFGREHLPRVRWLLSDQANPAPDIANPIPSKPILNRPTSPLVTVGIDNSVDSLLAIPKLKALLDAKDIKAHWSLIKSRDMDELLPSAEGNIRGEAHRQYRLAMQQRNQERYAPSVQKNPNLKKLIAESLEEHNINVHQDNSSISPFPGVAITVDDELLIGRQHLSLLNALL